jgi:hypothetical protein
MNPSIVDKNFLSGRTDLNLQVRAPVFCNPVTQAHNVCLLAVASLE